MQGSGVAVLARVATAGIAAFVLITLVMHPLESEFSPLEHMVSEYALGDYGVLMNAASLLLALGSAALAVGLWRSVRPTPLLPVALVATWSIGAAVAGVFNTDPAGAVESSTSGMLHLRAVTVAVLALVVATVLLARRFQHDPNWRPIAATTNWWALAMVATTVATLLSADSEIGGLVQRVWIVVLIGWLAYAAHHQRKLTTPAAARQAASTCEAL